jgi:beta-N-acetylhexosaminidase
MITKKNIQSTLLFSLIGFLILFANPEQSSGQETDPGLDEKIGQLIRIGFRGFEVDENSPVVRDIKAKRIGGVVLFDYDVALQSPRRNIQSPEQVKALVESLKSYSETPLLILIDQEGGRVARLKERHGFQPTVSAQYLGETGRLDSTAFYAARTAKTLSDLGINVNIAPVVDINVNPENPVIGGIERSFSSDTSEVAAHAREFILQHRNHNVFAVLKHFPGHGSSTEDSHLGLTDVTETWSESELYPYRKLIEEGHAEIIMTAHVYNANLDPDYPATLSRKVITGILRERLMFDGVIVSDDMNMKAITDHYGFEQAIKLALNAGVDVLAFGNNLTFDPDIAIKAHRIIKKLIKDGEISEERINESYNRVMRLKSRL